MQRARHLQLSLLFVVTTVLQLVLCNQLGAQPTPVLRHYTVDDGLPSSELYQTLQDSEGFVWFATDRGLSRFNGVKFKNYTTDDGLPDNAIARLCEDHQQRVWLLTANYRLAWFENDSLHLYPYNNQIAELIGSPSISSFVIDVEGTVHIGFMHDGYLNITQNGIITYSGNFGPGPGIFTAQIDSMPLHFGVLGSEKPRPGIVGKQFRFCPIQDRDEPERYYFQRRSNGTIAYAHNNRLTQINTAGDTVETLFDNRIIGLYEDSDQSFWVSFFKGGVKRYVGLEIRPENRGGLLQDQSVSSIYEDREGGLWLTTLEAGAYYIPSMDILTVNGLTDTYITEVDGDGQGNVFLGLRNGRVHRVNGQGIVEDTLDLNFGSRLPSPVSAIVWNKAQNELLLSTSSSIAVAKEGAISRLFFPDLFGLDHPILSADGTFWSRGRSGLYQFSKTQVIYRSSRDNQALNVTALHEDQSGQLWVGSTDGLYLFQARKFVHYGDLHPVLNEKIVDIKSLADGRLLLATSGSGLGILDNDSLTVLTTENGLLSNLISSVFVENDGRIWLGTNKGLNLITLDNNTATRAFTRQHGLISDEVQQVFVQDGQVWAITNKGASFFDPDAVPQNEVKPALFITGLKINNQDTTIHDSYRLPFDQNFLRVEFVGLAYRNAGHVPYRYRLEGLETEWQYTTDNSVQYTTLPDGSYSFVLQASNEDGVWSSQAGFSLEITPPFWRTWWFIVISILVVGASIWGIYYYRITQIKEQNRINQELHNYKHQALSAQMNPHFVFNSLNSIQNFILKNDKKEANRYLSKFAKLMRLTLDNSREMYITLEDELSALDLYMELERLRFKNKFDYSIDVSSDIDKGDVKIPATLIQPFVENAIWHGIVHKESEGHVYVEVHREGQQLLCSVEDDGIGREAAQEIKRQHRIKHKSAGMSITEKRLELVNSVHKNEMSYQIIDLKDENGNARGTRVEFNIPVLT